MYNINAHTRAQCCQMTRFDVEMTEHALQSGTALDFANNYATDSICMYEAYVLGFSIYDNYITMVM